MKGKCNGKTEVYSRVVGFYRPVTQCNDGKQEEFKDRQAYTKANGLPINGNQGPAYAEDMTLEEYRTMIDGMPGPEERN